MSQHCQTSLKAYPNSNKKFVNFLDGVLCNSLRRNVVLVSWESGDGRTSLLLISRGSLVELGWEVTLVSWEH